MFDKAVDEVFVDNIACQFGEHRSLDGGKLIVQLTYVTTASEVILLSKKIAVLSKYEMTILHGAGPGGLQVRSDWVHVGITLRGDGNF